MPCKPSGPLDAKIVLVGEAPGEQETITGLPFTGASGQELTRMLVEAGIDRKVCYLTNVFHERPDGNDLGTFCGNKQEVGTTYTLPPLSSGKYILPEHLWNLERLRSEIEAINPNIVVALGGTASWALLQAPKISTVRGTVAPGVLTSSKVLPTYHPAAILRNWTQRPIVVADLLKAAREAKFPEVSRPERTVYFDPDYRDLMAFRERLLEADILAVDIETKHKMITCIGFAPSSSEAFVFPFADDRNPTGSYWHSLEEEVIAWQAVQDILLSPASKVFQNGLYDMQYILRMGLRLHNVAEDTMILHHAMYPELEKSLGFLGSIYTNEASWKLLRPRGEDELKKDD